MTSLRAAISVQPQAATEGGELPDDALAQQEGASPLLSQQDSVLVVEDDPTVCDYLIEALEEEGYSGLRALNGKQALNVLRNLPRRPGLILLDLRMPEMSGWEFRRQQLQDPSLRGIPVVVLTASRDPDELRLLQTVTLHKPVQLDSLLDTVTLYLRSPDGSAN